jgi:hypothetical protein
MWWWRTCRTNDCTGQLEQCPGRVERGADGDTSGRGGSCAGHADHSSHYPLASYLNASADRGRVEVQRSP